MALPVSPGDWPKSSCQVVTDGHLILAAGALLAAGLVASLLAGRLRVPSLVLFLGVGMLVGSDGLRWIAFGDYRLERTIGVVSLGLILLEGGLTSGLLHLRPVLGAATALATVGTAITALARRSRPFLLAWHGWQRPCETPSVGALSSRGSALTSPSSAPRPACAAGAVAVRVPGATVRSARNRLPVWAQRISTRTHCASDAGMKSGYTEPQSGRTTDSALRGTGYYAMEHIELSGDRRAIGRKRRELRPSS